MGRLSLLLPLLCAVTFCVDAHPYSKIPDSAQFADGFASKKSSSNSLNGGFSLVDPDTIEFGSVQNGQAFDESKISAYSNNGASHTGGSSYSSASVSGAIPIGLVSSGTGDSSSGNYQSYGSSSDGNASGQQAGIQKTGDHSAGSQFWWMGPNSPFLGTGKNAGGCTPNGCLATTTFESKIHKTSGGTYGGKDSGHGEVKLQGNPFLHGGSANFGGSSVDLSSRGSASSGSSSFASSGSASTSSVAQGSRIDASRNPFLNGVGVVATGTSSGGYGTVGSSADTRNNLVGGGNSFFKPISSVPTFGQVPRIPSVSGNSGNPFFGSQVPQIPQFPKYPQVPQISHGSQGQENIYDEQQQVAGFPNYPLPNDDKRPNRKPNNDNPLQVTCSGEGHICVQYYLCSVDGYVISNSITQVRSGPQVCDLNNEVCCILKSPDQTTAVTAGGGIFGNGNINKQQPDLTSGGDGNSGRLPIKTNDEQENNGYLPPIGSAPSSNVPAFTNPPEDEKPDESGGSNSPVGVSIFPPAAVPPPQVGCAAALICVEDQFCSLGGVITTEPLSFTSEELIRRVPLSSCKNPDNGIIGKCCRDPNYVDPWPAGNLPANYSGGFDEQGFPTILNISKTRPNKKQSYNEGATKSGRPAIKTPYPAPNRQQVNPTPRPQQPQFVANNFPRPVEIPQPIPTPFPVSNSRQQVNPTPRPQQPQFVSNNFQRPVELPRAPYDQAVKSPSPFVLPNNQKSFNKNSYDTSSSNQNSAVIAPHVPGVHCGLRNTVQRPNGLSDVDVAFGEIPWQAMVLSNTDKKLLCSGAIIAPNAVVTAARCVEGFNPSQVSIKSGEWKLGYELKHEEPLPFEIINVASIEPYPAFTSGNPANDIAILFLERDMKLDQHVDVLCLPEGQPRPPKTGRKCIATGWGKTVLQVNVAGSLMHSLDVDVLGNEQCLQRISGAETRIPLDDSLVCAKAHKQNNNMCQVDFGGPLACDRGDGYYELAGIYNQDTGCLPTNQVATFATIPTRWIKEMMSKTSKYSANEYQSPTNVGRNPFVHNHGPKEPCNCQDHLLPAGSSQYLPPV